ncbi:MAG TPA: FlgD immunoglobulin-like domain containing protein [Gemmatimonadales bacterium]|nr:FlgD immunoglobulin-like domain containing protein [Gemmatimonadales bacterium]
MHAEAASIRSTPVHPLRFAWSIGLWTIVALLWSGGLEAHTALATTIIGVPSPTKSTCAASTLPGPNGSCCFDVTVRDKDSNPIPGSTVHIDFGACTVTFCPTQPAGVVVQGSGVSVITDGLGKAHICVCATFTGPCTATIYADGVLLCSTTYPGGCAPPDPALSICPCQIVAATDGTGCFTVIVNNSGGPISNCPVSVTYNGCTGTPFTKTCYTNSHGNADICFCGLTPPCTATIVANGVTLCTVPVVTVDPYGARPLFTDGLDGPAGQPLQGSSPGFGGSSWYGVQGTSAGIVFGPYGGVQDPGPNSHADNAIVGSDLQTNGTNTPFHMNTLGIYDVVHLQVVMANIAAVPGQNPFASTRVDLITNTSGGVIALGEFDTHGYWGASSGAGFPFQSTVSTGRPGDFLLDLYLDPNDVFRDGQYWNAIMTVRPTNGPATASNSSKVRGHINGLSCETVISGIDLIRNIENEVRFDNLSLEVTDHGPNTIFVSDWCGGCTGPYPTPHLAGVQPDVATGDDISGSLPWVGGLAWTQGGLEANQFHVIDPKGVEDAGPNSRNTNSWVTSDLVQPFALSALASYEGLHLRVTMANVAADAASNPLESSRVDLITNTSGGFISLGELGTDREWGANSFAGDSIESGFTTALAGPRQLDLYLDPNDAAGDGPSPNAYLQVDGGTTVPGFIEGLSSDTLSGTVISAVRLVRNVDDEVFFDDLLLEKTVFPITATAAVGSSSPRGTGTVVAAPNPFRVSTDVRFRLPAPTDVDVVVYDLAGRDVRTLHSGRLAPGEHAVQWDGLDARGTKASPGVYFIRVRAGGELLRASVVLLK